MKKAFFRIVNRFNKKILPKYSHLDPLKLTKFQKAILEYGKENFDWEQIDTAEDSNELALKETYYISKFDSINKGYNSNRGGGFKKTIYQYNLTGELESTFQSLEEASKSSSISEESISHACIGDRKTSNGFYWTYTSTFDLKEDIRKKKVIQYDFEGKKLNVFILFLMDIVLKKFNIIPYFIVL